MPLSPRRVLRTFKYAMYFDGVDDYVQIDDNPSINPSNEITVLLWTYSIQNMFGPTIWTCLRKGYSQYLLEPGDIGTNYWVFGAVVGGAFYKVDTTGPLPLFQWVQVGGRYSSSLGRLDIIVNGAVNNISRSLTGSIQSQSRPLYIGKFGGEIYTGYISQVLIYSRALSDSEILWNYQYPDNPIRNGLVLWLQADPNNVKDIDNDRILEWIDLSGYNNHGKIYGAQLVQLVKNSSRVLNPVRVLKTLR